MSKVLAVIMSLASGLLFGVYVSAQSNGAADSDQGQDKIYSNKEVSQHAKILTRPEPSLTNEARRKGVSGLVVLRAVFTAEGKVEQIEVVNGLPAGLTEAAIGAARQIKFEPARKDGRKVSTRIQLEYNFVQLEYKVGGNIHLSLPLMPGINTILVVNVTMPGDAVRIFGKPKDDRMEQLDASKLSAWLVDDHKESKFRVLTFKKLDRFSEMRLAFLDERLVMIDLHVKSDIEFPTENLGIYGIEFLPTAENSLDRLNNPPVRQNEARKRGPYSLLGISGDSFVYVDCVPSKLGQSDGILRIRQVSRTLQNSEGARQ